MRSPDPPYQRHSDTSKAAAEKIKPVLGRLQQLVFISIESWPATDEELCLRLPISANTVRPRRRELQQMGLIRDSGRRRPTISGRYAVVWEPSK
jgi:hypothetical protein